MKIEETIKDIEREIEIREKEAYQKGLVEAWCTASSIACMDVTKQFEIFNEIGDANIFGCYTAQGAVDKLKEYEQEENEIRVGDEVYLLDKRYPRVVTCIIKENVKNPMAISFTKKGCWAIDDVAHLYKTGRHFDQIQEVLNALKEVQNDNSRD